MTKELLREVLDEEPININYEDNKLVMSGNMCDTKGCNCSKTINIYELAHKCKEWAFNNDYEIETTYSGDVRIFKHSDSTIVNSQLGLEDCTEPEAIFKACKWILEQKKIEL